MTATSSWSHSDRHLKTKRIPRFSIEELALAVLYPSDLKTAEWVSVVRRMCQLKPLIDHQLPLLLDDIRSVPALPRLTRRQTATDPTSSESTSSGTVSTAPTSMTEVGGENVITSVAVRSPDGTRRSDAPQLGLGRIKKTRRKTRVCYAESSDGGPDHRKRYWNEYDDGDEAFPGEPYTILIDPVTDTGFPGRKALSISSAAAARVARMASSRLKAWLVHDGEDEEQRPLQGHPYTQRVDPSSSEGERWTRSKYGQAHRRQRYGTFADDDENRLLALHGTDDLLIPTCVGCFVSAFVISSIVAIVTGTGSDQLRIPLGLFVVGGVAMSFLCAVAGLTTLLVRRRLLRWRYRTIGLVTFAGIFLVDAVLLARYGAAA